MKQWITLILATTAAALLQADEASSVDFFAGWSWAPYPYADAPYRRGPPFGRPWVGAGLAMPLSERDESHPFAAYDRFGPFRGYDYGVRFKLNGAPEYPKPPNATAEPLPGSAPLEPRNRQLENRWDQEIAAFIGTLAPAREKQITTNAPPRAEEPKP
ncbi:MAG TPA: hypothetical protein PKM57_02540 [Kiritimatiellia bacterium]|nr:hypothetical protein [Kiritimatiellia bacterium]HPS05892.1 hypothetical protein [Kiritimatiellia bacterium]